MRKVPETGGDLIFAICSAVYLCRLTLIDLAVSCLSWRSMILIQQRYTQTRSNAMLVRSKITIQDGQYFVLFIKIFFRLT